MRRLVLMLALASGLLPLAALAAPPDANDGNPVASLYEQLVLADKPAAYWRMIPGEGKSIRCTAAESKVEPTGTAVGAVALKQAGPRPGDFPLFEKDNVAIQLSGAKGFLRVSDPGEKSILDFSAGDAITLEAWVNPFSLKEGQQVYVVGKGRTNNEGVPRENQNYALRLRCLEGTARISFLFRSQGEKGAEGEFHRWNSDQGFESDSGWHHVAVSFHFGKRESPRAFLDGREVKGRFDMGGPTERPPVVDDDELWIGSSLGGNPGNTFVGLIDEVAIYRSELLPERIEQRYRYAGPPPEPETIDPAALPADAVLLEVLEGVQEHSWNLRRATETMTATLPAMAMTAVPHKYNARGVIDDRTNPYVVRLQVKRQYVGGKYRLLLRSLNASRLSVDGKVVVQTDFLIPNASGHERVPELAPVDPSGLRPLPQGHQERIVEMELAPGEHVFRQEFVVGGSKLRLEAGQPCVAIAKGDEPFEMLVPGGGSPVALTEDGWASFAERLGRHVERLNGEHRRAASAEEDRYWKLRHELAREEIARRPAIVVPDSPAGYPAHNEIDRFLNARLTEASVKPSELTDDYAFLRRVTLDCTGLPPTRQEIAAFLADRRPHRREAVINRLLADARWADHGVSYWQDVLAENPGIVKPTLNNTGPFRWWIYESLVDNKPLDRFASELVMMEGSVYYGGPAGFGMATENDAPLAEKAHVLAKAFLGQEMKCARCHDAPQHPFLQRDLFSLAAMLDRQTMALPKTSTVPTLPGGRQPLISITLKPGDRIDPAWPFADLVSAELPEGVLRNADDPRERLAAMLTSPANDRFAQVAVNRLWKRLMGQGIVEPADDWHESGPSHPELLNFLARELASHGYDVKHVARLILASHAYQRESRTPSADGSEPARRLFASPARRRMTAEQLLDSLFAAAEKPLDSDPLTLDPEGRLPVQTFLHLGVPRRAWQLTSMSTDRDRPALGLPRAQALIDFLTSFGWRDSRPSPITQRDEEPNVLQPLSLASGVVSARIARLSDDHAATRLAVEAKSVDVLVEQVFLQFVSRGPSEKEREQFEKLLTPGFEQRIVQGDLPAPRPKIRRHAVSWSNHLSPEATKIKLQMEREVLSGDEPTARLAADWRERLEDVIWALANSPEFVFVP
ncbi:MAG: DUF1553 domain-containing protein [Planctomycetia bacterium]|nr:DUF1553 domain-containing protein [Planctomycetia bacterium]